MTDPAEIPLLPAQIMAERTHMVIPSLPSWIEPTVEFLRQKAVLSGACQETRSGKLLIALHEAISNAIIHGNLELSSELKERGDAAFAEALAQRSADPTLAGRKVDIVVDFDGSNCRWVITDQGRGFDVDRVLRRCLSDDPEILLASGRGILMMKSFLDDVRFDLGGRRVILSLSRPSGDERRQDYRVPLFTPFQVTPVLPDGTPHWSESYEAVSRNFSERGIALLQQQLSFSEKVLIGVLTEQGIVHIPAEVRHTRALGADGMELGCQFVGPIAPGNPLSAPAPPIPPHLDEVHQVVAGILLRFQANQLPSHERRTHPRVVFNERVEVLAEGRGPLVGYARDLSKGGLAIIVQEQVADDITISFAPAADRQNVRLRCRVVRCSRIQDGFFDVGATFLRVNP